MKSSSSSSSSSNSMEAKLDLLEQKLKEKIEVLSGFADANIRARKLQQQFAIFDSNGSGNIDYKEFFAAMTKFNFVGVQREIEALFNRYDDDASGEIDYKEFAYSLFGVGDKPSQMDPNSRNIVDKVKARIIQKDGASGIHSVARTLKRLDTDGSKSLDRDELQRGLREYGVTTVSAPEMNTLFNYFDRDQSGRVSLDEFLRGLSAGMNSERKALVRQAFDVLDSSGRGEIRVEDVMRSYNFNSHPNVMSGKMTGDKAAEEMLSVFEQGGDVDGVVSWVEFLDYYKGLSVAIDNDAYFQLMIRNAWHLSGGEGQAANTSCKRVCVIHYDGSEEIVELTNDIGLNLRDRNAVLKKLQNQGVTDISSFKI